MRINLNPELEAFIARQVESGRYRGASEVVREALRRMQQSDEPAAVASGNADEPQPESAMASDVAAADSATPEAAEEPTTSLPVDEAPPAS